MDAFGASLTGSDTQEEGRNTAALREFRILEEKRALNPSSRQTDRGSSCRIARSSDPRSNCPIWAQRRNFSKRLWGVFNRVWHSTRKLEYRRTRRISDSKGGETSIGPALSSNRSKWSQKTLNLDTTLTAKLQERRREEKNWGKKQKKTRMLHNALISLAQHHEGYTTIPSRRSKKTFWNKK